MKERHELEIVKHLISGGKHVPPSVEVLKSELRSDDGFEPPLPPLPSSLVYVIVKWKYHVRTARLEEFHTFLKDFEEQIVGEVKDLRLEAAYLGTYAELPRCRLHQTLWSYSSTAEIDKFKAALASRKSSSLYKNLAMLVSFVDDATMGMHRLVRASALAGQVTERRKSDPILDMFAAID